MAEENNQEGLETPEPTQPDSDTPDVPEGDNDNQGEKVFPADYVKELRAENAKRRKEQKTLEKRLAELQSAEEAREEAALAQQEKWQELADKRKREIEELQAQLKAQTVGTLRLRIATELNLPPALADRLRGDTEEDIREDAQALLDAMPKPTNEPPPEPDKRSTRSPVAPDGNPQGESKKQKDSRLFGKGTSSAFTNATLVTDE